MSQICQACKRPSTHRVLWNKWLEVYEAKPSKHPVYCQEHAVSQSVHDNAMAKSVDAYERSFDYQSRLIFRTDVPVPHIWIVHTRTYCKRHESVINPGGLVRVYQQDNYLFVELYPPKDKPSTWNPQHCLFLIRYLVRQPLVFVAVEHGATLSPSTYRESRVRLASTMPPLMMDPEPAPSSE